MRNIFKTYDKKVGIFLIVLSGVLWLLVPVVPFLGFRGSIQAVIITLLLVIGEIIFWVGSVMVGKEMLKKLNLFKTISRWFKRKNTYVQGE